MLSRVQKWGNTLAVRIPQTFAEQAGLSSDTSVELTLVNG
jgi:antitoxin MazE